MNMSQAEKDYETMLFEIIEEEREKLENVISTIDKERQERYRKVFEKICEIEVIEDRAFTVIAFVSELTKTLRTLEELLRDDE